MDSIEKIVSKDGSVKELLSLEDGLSVEAVWIPQEHGAIVCVSCQVGCPNKCRHCATANVGYERDLTCEEITDQVQTLLENHGYGKLGATVLFMGMGEPLLNYDNVIGAVAKLVDRGTINQWSNAVLSTSGITPGIKRLSDEKESPTLAVTLGALPERKRERLLPHTKMFPLDALLDACWSFNEKLDTRLIFEVPLIPGFNNYRQDASAIAKICKDFDCQLEVVPFNEFSTSEFRLPTSSEISEFVRLLEDDGCHVTTKPSYGKDVYGGCGQLAQTSADVAV